MSKSNKSYRIRTNINSENQYINVDIVQNYEKFEILSLDINQSNVYNLMNSKTGIIVGRVLANDGFGIPNAKLSVFITYDSNDNLDSQLQYHYVSTNSTNEEGIRYNLLPNTVDDECKQAVGTLPIKRFMLDNKDVIEVFDKYYRYTTRTNNSGDYMIYGVPTGSQTIHCDIDLSDIGVLSQKPSDMIYKGYDINLFESPTKFKTSTNLNSLSQLISQDKSVFVYPFWGDTTNDPNGAAITRCDINISYKFEPTCVFMGSVITDTGSNSISKKCKPSKNGGKMSEMKTGAGIIEMIRKTVNGGVEQISIKGNEVINEDGVWCYQIPMNLDYVMTDEYGNTVISDNPSKGIPTRTRVRFRVSMHENPADGVARKRARYLIPNNPRLVKEDYPEFCKTKNVDYEFGTKTLDEDYRDLMWNNVYTVKNYIPRVQKARLPNNLKFTGIKMVNHAGSNNPMPYNKLSIKFNFMYTFMCTLIKILVQLTGLINQIITSLGWYFLSFSHWCVKESNNDDWYTVDIYRKIFFNIHGYSVKEAIEADTDSFLDDWNKCSGRTGATAIFCRFVYEYIKHCKNTYDGNLIKGINDEIWADLDIKGLGWWFLKIGVILSEGITLRGLCESEDGISIDITPKINENIKRMFNNGKFEDQTYSCLQNLLYINNNISELYNCVENQLAQENEVTSFNFFNDWVNGVLYMPLWYRKVKPKRKLFGFIKLKGKDIWCDGRKSVRLRDLKLYSNCVITRDVHSDGVTITPLNDDYSTVNVEDSIANDESGEEELVFKKKNETNCWGFQCHKKGRSETPIREGLIIEKETMLGDEVYYYKPVYKNSNITEENELVRLFATDIVLLGSLNTCDLHGIPQFFKILESTSYQMPPDLLEEDYSYNENNNNIPVNDENENLLIDESTRKTEFTGADWGNLGIDQSNYNQVRNSIWGERLYEANENIYDNGGLFYGITCFDSYTKPKSIINLERICEIGVSLDETQELLTNTVVEDSDSIDENSPDFYTDLTPDGYISYDEIYNPDYRSMFATLNGNFLRTKVNPETGLVEYDLTHVYLTNFDGSLKNIMAGGATQGYLLDRNNNSLTTEQANYLNNHNLEFSDSNYVLFRYGNYKKLNGKKVFYYEHNKTMTGNVMSKNKIPRYENSFYFYFGLTEGKTAIDKFYSTYYADCGKNEVLEKRSIINFEPNDWCSESNGYITITSDMEIPLNIKISDLNNVEKIYTAELIEYKNFYVGSKQEENSDVESEYKYVKLINEDNNEIDFLPKGEYSIEIIDMNGDILNDRLSFKNTNYITYTIDKYDFNITNDDLIKQFGTEEGYARVEQNYCVEYEGELLIPYEYTIFGSNNITNFGKYGYTEYGKIIDNFITGNKEFISENYEYDFNTNKLINSNGEEITDYREEIGIIYKNQDGEIKLEKCKNYKNGIIDTKYYKGTSSNEIDNIASIKNTNILGPYFYNRVADSRMQFYVENNGASENNLNLNVNNINETDKVISNNNPILRNIYGYLILSNFSENDYKITVETAIENELIGFNGYECICFNNNISITGHGYLGIMRNNDSKLNQYYVGLPFGNTTYKITVTMLCSDNENGGYKDVGNQTITYVTVYEGNLKLFINGIDYNLIKYFKTGWTDTTMDALTTDPDNNNFNHENIRGWNDIKNIGLTESGLSLYPIEFTGDNINIDDINLLGNALFKDSINTYTQETTYNWNDSYIIKNKEWNELSDGYELVKDKNGKNEGEDGYIPTYEGDIITKCNLINTIIDNRIKLTKKMMGTFRPNSQGSVGITLSGETKSKPVKYIVVYEPIFQQLTLNNFNIN